MALDAETFLKELPRLLKERPDLRLALFQALSEDFSAREETNQLLRELRELREAMDKRFEAAERRFEAIECELKDLREAMDRRFEAMDKRFEAAERRFEAIDMRFAAVDQRFDAIEQRFDDLKDWVSLLVGGFQRRAGRGLEDLAAGALRIALSMQGIGPEHVRTRQRVVDERGVIGPAGRTYEYDLLAYNGQTWVFEVKSAADVEAVERFSDKVRLVSQTLGRPEAKGALLTLDKPSDVVEACRQHGLLLA